MIFPLIYTVLNCMNYAPELNAELTKATPGNKSFGVVRECELRYDKEIKWAQGVLLAKLHLQQKNCVSLGCWNEYNADLDVKIKAEMGDGCRIEKIDITPIGTNVEGWVIEKVFPVVERRIEATLQAKIEDSILEHPEFAEACR